MDKDNTVDLGHSRDDRATGRPDPGELIQSPATVLHAQRRIVTTQLGPISRLYKLRQTPDFRYFPVLQNMLSTVEVSMESNRTPGVWGSGFLFSSWKGRERSIWAGPPGLLARKHFSEGTGAGSIGPRPEG